MANSASHAALPYPIRGARFSILVPYLDADGDPTAPTTPDTEVSKDNGAAADAAEEVSATSGMDGMGLITFTGAETDCTTLGVNFKAASGPKATLATLYPRTLAEVGTGTLSAGSAGGGTLGTLLAYDVTGCFIKTTGGTGGGGTGGANNQARKIATYNTGTGAFTVVPDWETTPSTDTTYAILLPEGVTLGMLRTLNPTTAGRTLTIESDGMAHADLKEMLGVAQSVTDLKDFADDGYDPSTNKVQGVVLADTVTTLTNKTGFSLTANTGLGNQTADITGNLSGSVGSVTGAVGSVTGAVGSVTGAVGSVTGNVGGNVTGSVGSVLGEINVTSGTIKTLDALDTAQDTQHSTTQTYLTNNLGSAGAAATEAGGTGDHLTAVPWNAAWDAEVQSEVQDALDGTLADSVPADGTRPSLSQAAYMLIQLMTESSISGTTLTVRKVDGSTALYTLTLNDATNPTASTRAT